MFAVAAILATPTVADDVDGLGAVNLNHHHFQEVETIFFSTFPLLRSPLINLESFPPAFSLSQARGDLPIFAVLCSRLI